MRIKHKTIKLFGDNLDCRVAGCTRGIEWSVWDLTRCWHPTFKFKTKNTFKTISEPETHKCMSNNPNPKSTQFEYSRWAFYGHWVFCLNFQWKPKVGKEELFLILPKQVDLEFQIHTWYCSCVRCQFYVPGVLKAHFSIQIIQSCETFCQETPWKWD